ncbi:MAG: hypothetical protein Q8O14_09730 [bacterium]|nr:hypothetical protein [bacterium]
MMSLLILMLILPAGADLLPLTRVVPGGLSPEDSLIVVMDRSTPEGSGLGRGELLILAQTCRGAVAGTLATRGYTLLSEEATRAARRGLGLEADSCGEEGERLLARELQADWLLTLRVDQAGPHWSVQVTLRRVAGWIQVDERTRRGTARRELGPLLEEAVGDLFASHLLPGEDRGRESVDPSFARPFFRSLLARPDAAGSSWTGTGRPPTRRRPGPSGIRNQIYLEAGFSPTFFYPRPKTQQATGTVAWGGGLRLADPTRSRYDLVLDWWRADEDELGYTMLRALAEITPLHVGPIYPYVNAGYQVIKTNTRQDERLLLGGAGLEFRTRGMLAVAGGMDFMKDRKSKIRFSSVNRCWHAELALAGANFGLGVVGLFGADIRSNASVSARLRVFHQRGTGLPGWLGRGR